MKRARTIFTSTRATAIVGAAVAALSSAVVFAGPANAFYVQPCSVTGPKIVLGTVAPFAEQYVEAGNACWAPNSTVVLRFVETFNGLGPTTTKYLVPVTRAVNTGGNWAPYPLPPPGVVCYPAFSATLSVTADNEGNAGTLLAHSNPVSVPVACGQG